MVEVTKRFIDRSMNKENVVFTYIEVLFSLKKNENLSHVTTWMKLGDVMLSV